MMTKVLDVYLYYNLQCYFSPLIPPKLHFAERSFGKFVSNGCCLFLSANLLHMFMTPQEVFIMKTALKNVFEREFYTDADLILHYSSLRLLLYHYAL